MKQKKGIRQKLTTLVVVISVVALLMSIICSSVIMVNMANNSVESALNDAIEQVTEIAQTRATLADSMLTLAQNQTLLVAEGAENILKNKDKYLRGYNEEDLLKLTCDDLGFINVLVPEELLTDIVNDGEKNVSAKINGEIVTESGLTVNEELYLGSFLTNELSQIYKFKTPGTVDEYKGFAASYFCYADSGIDVLGDPKMNNIIGYDGRTRGWYVGAVEAYKNNTLTASGVYWTEPIPDGAGRGTSMVCSAPVVIDGEIVGVAGSGGLINDFADLVKSSTIGSTGYSFMISRSTSKIIINPKNNDGETSTSEVSIETDLSTSKNTALAEFANTVKNSDSGRIDSIYIDGEECLLAYSALENNDWTMVTVISRSDDIITATSKELNSQMISAFIFFIVLVSALIVVVVIISSRFSKRFTKPIIELKNGVDKIGEGHLDQLLDIKTGDEIEELGNAFNAMAVNLDTYVKTLTTVTAEKERIGAELDVATHIQASMLPCIFPAFPDRKDFDIYATMTPAKEVGGDFYDFFMVDKTHLAIVMADVSGKGVPAALFMVIGKTLIKDHTQLGKELGEVFSEVNNILCEANSEGLFITAFEGILDLETGELKFVNAGHEMPFIFRKEEGYKPYKIKPGFVLAGMEDMLFKGGTVQLQPGDKIFQYTDGVTEATNGSNQLFGMERLEQSLNSCEGFTPAETLAKVKADIDAFVGDAPQFDDITMLCVDYKSRPSDVE